MYKNFLFDLDGTLLPMDMEKFTEIYFASLCKKCCPIIGVEPDTLVKAVWKGTTAMVKNDNSVSNKDAFWEAASAVCGKELAPFIGQFDRYYEDDFLTTKQATSLNEYAAKSVELIKKNGGRLIAATNPIFPRIATERRLRWAGVSPEDFELITSYENCGSCKPNLLYYKTICEKTGIKPEESLIVGNDVDEDMCAAELGFDTYLITDCLINRSSKDISVYKNGSFKDFYDFLTDCINTKN